MRTIDLSPEEEQLLEETLDYTLSDLRMEIADTDSSAFKEKLRGRKETLNSILSKLKQPS